MNKITSDGFLRSGDRGGEGKRQRMGEHREAHSPVQRRCLPAAALLNPEPQEEMLQGHGKLLKSVSIAEQTGSEFVW